VCHALTKKYPNVITLDVGGTSSDCALIPGSIPAIRRETVIGTLSVKAPSIDVHTVGAGGGSIASYAAISSNLRVGPESAGANPGPACYGRGGKSATVTDANLVLGYIPSTLLGGDFKLDVGAAVSAVESLATEMGLSTEDTALAIINLVNETMYGAVRVVSVEQGYDPKDFALVAFGGAGPLHGNAIGELLQSWPVIIPPSPGILCAQGDVVTKLSHDKTSSYIRVLSLLDLDELRGRLKELESSCYSTLLASTVNITVDTLETVFQVDLRYEGQSQSMTITIEGPLLKRSLGEVQEVLRAKFEVEHQRHFSFIMPTYRIELIRVRTIVSDGSPEVVLSPLDNYKGGLAPPESAMISKRQIYCDGKRVEAIFWDRKALTFPGVTVAGPCVISEMDSNTLVLPGYVAQIDDMGNIIINPKEKVRQEAPRIFASPDLAKEHVATTIIPTLISSALSSIRREMDSLVLRASMSPGIREQQV
jgi:5-oxoprolinase (ATP-hydrolysing)